MQTVQKANYHYSNIEWVEKNRIDGAGNSSSLLNYSTYDANPYIGVSYYRLKQTDFDGVFSYSNMVTVNINNPNSLSIYPNPTNDIITITGNEYDLKDIKVLNSLGQDVTRLTKFDKQGKEIVIIDLSALSKGVYIVKTETTAQRIYKY